MFLKGQIALNMKSWKKFSRHLSKCLQLHYEFLPKNLDISTISFELLTHCNLDKCELDK